MMKARMALANEFENKTAQRMTGKDGRSYTFTKEDADSINKQYPGANSYQGQKGNVMVGSYDNFVTPSIQDINGKLLLDFFVAFFFIFYLQNVIYNI